MSILYAMRAKKVDLALMTLLNNGVAPEIPKKGEQWFLVNIAEDGSSTTTQVLTKRELFKDFDIKGQAGHSPFIMRMKRIFNE